MDIQAGKQGQVQVLKLRGSIKLGEPVDRLRDVMDPMIAAGETRILFNLAEVPTADSTGIGALVRYQASLKQRGGALKLVSPSQFVVQTLKILGLHRIFDIYDTESAAVSSFSPESISQPAGS